MGLDWMPGAEKVLADTTYEFVSPLPVARGILHTTEGTSVEGAIAAYRKHHGWPHFTVSESKIVQHIPLSRAGGAMKNGAGGVQTNRANAIQIEIVGTCDTGKKNHPSWSAHYVENFSKKYLNNIAKVMRFVEEQKGIKRIAPVPSLWIAYPGSYGFHGRQRMSSDQWNSFNGWCGHQHAPENDHGDPGLLDIAYLLGRKPSPASKPKPPKWDGAAWVPGARPNRQNQRDTWLWASSGEVKCVRGATFYGDARKALGKAQIVALVPTHTGRGYLMVAGNGKVFAFGDARDFGGVAKRDAFKNGERRIVGAHFEPGKYSYVLIDNEGDAWFRRK